MSRSATFPTPRRRTMTTQAQESGGGGLSSAASVPGRPIIGWRAPAKQDTGKARGRPSALTRSRRPRSCLVSTPGSPSPSRSRCSGMPAKWPSGAAPHTPAVRPATKRGAGRTRTGRPYWTGSRPSSCRRTGPVRCRASSPTLRAWRHARPAARSCPRWRRCCRSCGAGQPIWPRATTPPWIRADYFIPSRRQTKQWHGGPSRADAALRHPRARHGCGAERDRPAVTHPRLRRDVPDLQRLHARPRCGWRR